MRIARVLLALLAAASLSLPPSGVEAQDRSSDGLTFGAYLQLVAAKARAAGVREASIQATIAGLTPNQRVIDLDRAQPGTPSSTGFPPLAPYIRDHVDANRIAGGDLPLGGCHRRVELRLGVDLRVDRARRVLGVAQPVAHVAGDIGQRVRSYR